MSALSSAAGKGKTWKHVHTYIIWYGDVWKHVFDFIVKRNETEIPFASQLMSIDSENTQDKRRNDDDDCLYMERSSSIG